MKWMLQVARMCVYRLEIGKMRVVLIGRDCYSIVFLDVMQFHASICVAEEGKFNAIV